MNQMRFGSEMCFVAHKEGRRRGQKDACFWEANELWAEEVLISLAVCLISNYGLVQMDLTLKCRVVLELFKTISGLNSNRTYLYSLV